MLKTMLNVVGFSSRPYRLRIVAKKAFAKLAGKSGREADSGMCDWCAKRRIDYSAWAEEQNPALWREAEDFAKSFEESAFAKLSSSKVKFGGGGAYSLLYFLVRQRRPEFVVETGVAAGWSSAA